MVNVHGLTKPRTEPRGKQNTYVNCTNMPTLNHISGSQIQHTLWSTWQTSRHQSRKPNEISGAATHITSWHIYHHEFDCQSRFQGMHSSTGLHWDPTYNSLYTAGRPPGCVHARSTQDVTRHGQGVRNEVRWPLHFRWDWTFLTTPSPILISFDEAPDNADKLEESLWSFPWKTEGQQ